MADGDNIREFQQLITAHAKSHVKVQTAWAVVKSVDWENKTMVATGVLDGLDYNDVLLGIGSILKKPAPGSKCLLGMIENKDAASFLIEGETIEAFEFRNGSSELQGLALGVAVKEILDALFDELGSTQVITMIGLQSLLNAIQISSLKAMTDKIVSQLIFSNK